MKGETPDINPEELIIPPHLDGLLRSSIIIGQEQEQLREKDVKEFERLIGLGYLNLTDAAELIKIKNATLHHRSLSILLDKDYLIDGTKPKGKENEVTVKGSFLKWQQPYGARLILLHPAYVEGMKKAEEIEQQLKNQGYVTLAKAMKESGIAKSRLSNIASKIIADEDYLLDGTKPKTKEEKTVKGSALIWRHPYDSITVLINPDFLAKIKEADKKIDDLLQNGYMPQADAARMLDLNLLTLARRTRDIDPSGNYLQDGKKPTGAEGEILIKGAELRWQHPYDRNSIVLKKTYVEALLDAKKTEKKLKDSGYVEQTEAAKKINIKPGTLIARTVKIDESTTYLENGLEPLDLKGEITLEGSALRWAHPFDKKVLLHPKYIAGMKLAEEKSAELIKIGYVKQSELAKELNLGAGLISSRTKLIKKDGFYLKNGLEPTGETEEITIKGSELRWEHPYSKDANLLHPEYAGAMRAAEKEFSRLISEGYVKQSDLEKQLDVTHSALQNRTRNIVAGESYLENGLKPAGITGEILVKGSELRKQHPYNQSIVLIHPKFAAGMRAAKKAGDALIEQGYVLQSNIATGKKAQSTVANKTRKINSEEMYLEDGSKPIGSLGEKVIKGSDLRWQSPYDSAIILLHPKYAKLLIAEGELKKGAEAEKLGDAVKVPNEAEDHLAEIKKEKEVKKK